MYDITAVIIFSIIAIYSGAFLFLPWISPKSYRKFMDSHKEVAKLLAVGYSEKIYNYFSGTTGIGFWVMRLLMFVFVIISIIGIIYGIWGIWII